MLWIFIEPINLGYLASVGWKQTWIIMMLNGLPFKLTDILLKQVHLLLTHYVMVNSDRLNCHF